MSGRRAAICMAIHNKDAECLRRVMASIAAQEGIENHQICIIDDASDDSPRDLVLGILPWADFRRVDHKGFDYSMNFALDMVAEDVDVIVMQSADVEWVEPTGLETILQNVSPLRPVFATVHNGERGDTRDQVLADWRQRMPRSGPGCGWNFFLGGILRRDLEEIPFVGRREPWCDAMLDAALRRAGHWVQYFEDFRGIHIWHDAIWVPCKRMETCPVECRMKRYFQRVDGQEETLPTISACLMVKDEEELLGQCLWSIRQLVDEIIVVDTGSTDKTVEIAKRFGAKVFHHPWEDNFSVHRNQSLGYATGDWVLIIDADEKLRYNTSEQEVKAALKVLPDAVAAVQVPIVNVKKANQQSTMADTSRFFRRGRVTYRRRVHNRPQIEGVATRLPGITVLHYGYDLSPEKMAVKFARSRALLLQELEETGSVEMLFFLQQLCGQHERLEEAVDWGSKYLAAEKERTHQQTYWSQVKMLLRLDREDEAFSTLMTGLESEPDDPDLNFLLAEYHAAKRQPLALADACRTYLAGREKRLQRGFGDRTYFTLGTQCAAALAYKLMYVTAQEMLAANRIFRTCAHPPAMDAIYRETVKELGLDGLPDFN